MVNLKDKMALLSPERRAKIEVEADRLQDEYLTLQALRKAKALTQSQLAETLGYQQATIAQMDQAVEAVEDLFIMSDGNDAGFLLGRELAQKVHHQLCAPAVERGRGLIG